VDSNSSLHERFLAITWLVATYDLWDKNALDGITYRLETRDQLPAFPLSTPRDPPPGDAVAIAIADVAVPVADPRGGRSLPTTSQVSAEHVVAAYGRLNHLLRKYKLLRVAHVRNTHALARAFRRVLDMPPPAAAPPLPAAAGTSGGRHQPAAAPGNDPGKGGGEALKVHSVADGLSLLRMLTEDDVHAVLDEVERAVPPRPAARGPDGTPPRPRPRVVGRMSEPSHAHAMAALDRRAHVLRRAGTELAESRRHEASFYRWAAGCKVDPSTDAAGPQGKTDAGGGGTRAWRGWTEADAAMVADVDAAVDAVLLPDGDPGACRVSAAAARRALLRAEAELRHAGVPAKGSDAQAAAAAMDGDHPLYRLHRQRCAGAAAAGGPRVVAQLTALRATHHDVLRRVAGACAPSCPYTIQFT
jgi:hypothetical protein